MWKLLNIGQIVGNVGFNVVAACIKLWYANINE